VFLIWHHNGLCVRVVRGTGVQVSAPFRRAEVALEVLDRVCDAPADAPA
jgi:hypothetical protein